METKDTPAIVMQDETQSDFTDWFHCQDHYLPFLILVREGLGLDHFDKLPFVFKSGVYTAYLRYKGIEIDYSKSLVSGRYLFAVNANTDNLHAAKDYNIALIAAINEGFRIREEQLTKTYEG